MREISYVLMNSDSLTRFGGVLKKQIGEKNIREIVEEAREKGEAKVVDNIVLTLLMDESSGYTTTLYLEADTRIPLVKSVGAIGQKKGCLLWGAMKMLSALCGYVGVKRNCPEVPFIADMIYPTIAFAPYVLNWFQDFNKSFGAMLLEELEKEQKKAANYEETMQELQMIADARESVKEWLLYGFAKKGTFKNLPEELRPYQYYLADSGNVIMAVPECILQEAIKSGNLSNYEVAIPCSYVIQHGYRFYGDYVVVDVRYDSEIGLEYIEEDW